MDIPHELELVTTVCAMLDTTKRGLDPASDVGLRSYFGGEGLLALCPPVKLEPPLAVACPAHKEADQKPFARWEKPPEPETRPTPCAPPRKRKPSGLKLSYNQLLSVARLSLEDASKTLGVGATVFKLTCRSKGVRAWPYRKIAAMDKLMKSCAVAAAQGECWALEWMHTYEGAYPHILEPSVVCNLRHSFEKTRKQLDAWLH